MCLKMTAFEGKIFKDFFVCVALCAGSYTAKNVSLTIPISVL